MHIDLSTLQIPDVSVVPEPTAEDVKVFREFLHDPPPVVTFRVACHFARRYRTLEERDHQAAAAYAAKRETQKYLEAEVERLKRNIETVVEYMDTGEGSFPESWNIRDHLKGALDGN